MRWSGAFLLVLLVGSLFPFPRFGPNAALVDLLLAGCIAFAIINGRLRENPVWLSIRASYWVIVLTSVLASAMAGFPPWALLATGRDLYSLLIFPCVLVALNAIVPSIRLLRAGVLGGLAVVAVSTLLVTSERARLSGFLPNPNYAAVATAASLAVYWYLQRSTLLRVASVALAAPALVATSSFGAVVFLGVIAAVCLLSVVRRRAGDVRFLASAMLLVATVLLFFDPVRQRSSAWLSSNTQWTSNRLDRSTSNRFLKWETAWETFLAHPIGVGPRGIVELGIDNFSTHNDYLNFLAERGLFGLVGLALLYASLIRYSARTSAFLLGFVLAVASQSLFREVLNYRFLWVLAAVVVFAGSADEVGRSIDRSGAQSTMRRRRSSGAVIVRSAERNSTFRSTLE